MGLSRRKALIGATALGLIAAAAPARAAVGSRELTLYRGEDPIGGQTLTVRRDGDTVTADIRIEIAVRLLGIPAYGYRLTAQETWAGGALQTLRAETDDNGTAQFARADRVGAELVVEGSAYAGPAPGDVATTSYWSPAFLARPVWLSTQDGRLLDVTATNLGATAFPAAGGTVEAARWRIGGDLTDLFLYYDAAGEWLGNAFTARGETARFVASGVEPALTPLWVDG